MYIIAYSNSMHEQYSNAGLPYCAVESYITKVSWVTQDLQYQHLTSEWPVLAV